MSAIGGVHPPPPSPPPTASGVEEKVREELGEKPWRVEGLYQQCLGREDYVDVVVHIFRRSSGIFYKIEELWADVPVTRYDGEKNKGNARNTQFRNIIWLIINK